jgi:hypothetical protein
LDQGDIDVVMAAPSSGRHPSPPTTPAGDDADPYRESAAAPASARPREITAMPAAESGSGPVRSKADPLAPIQAMTYEERIALFS